MRAAANLKTMNIVSPSIANDQENFDVFLQQAGWGKCQVVALGADMGLRRYFRLTNDQGENALLMDMSRAGVLESALDSYIKIADFFAAQNIQTPEIYHYDLKNGLAVIQDFGDVSFGRARADGVPAQQIYKKATDVLIQMKDGFDKNQLGLKEYKDTLIRDRLKQFVEYYMPVAAGRMTDENDYEEFQSVMAQIEATLPPCPMGICHADFHLENLMWCPDQGQGYGVIDFQDAFWGPQPYDLLNALEDARQTVPADIKQQMKAYYCAGMDAQEKETFEAWYSYMSMHFHCRVIGLFIKFAKEGRGRDFLAHISRLQGYITDNLDNPLMSPLKQFMDRHKVSFDIDVTQHV